MRRFSLLIPFLLALAASARATVTVTVTPLCRSAAFTIDTREVAPTLWDSGTAYGPWTYPGTRAMLEWSTDNVNWKDAQDFVRVQADRFKGSNFDVPDPRMATMLFGLAPNTTYYWRVSFSGTGFTAETATGSFTTEPETPPVGGSVTLAITSASSPEFKTAINAAVGASGENDIIEFRADSPGGSVTFNGSLASVYHGGYFDADGTSAGWLLVRGRAGDEVIFDGSDPDYDGGADMWDLYTDAGLGITADDAIYRTKVAYYDPANVDTGVQSGAGLRPRPNLICYERPPATDAWRLQDLSAGAQWQTEGGSVSTSTGLATLKNRADNYDGEGAFVCDSGYVYVRLHDGRDPETQASMKIAVWKNPLDLYDSSYVVFRNLKFRYFRSGQWIGMTEKVAGGVGLNASHHVMFDGCHFQGLGYAIHTLSASADRHHITVKGCTFEEHGVSPEYIGGSWWSPYWPHLKASREEDWAVRLRANAVSVLDCTVSGYHNGVTAGEVVQGSPAVFALNTDYATAWEVDGNTFSRCLDDAVELETWVVCAVASRNTATEAVYKFQSMAPVEGGPVYSIRNTYHAAGEFGSMVYKQTMFKIGNGSPGDCGYKLIANNSTVAQTAAPATPLVGLSSSGRTYNIHAYNNYVACDTLGVDWGDGSLGYPHHFDYNRYALSRKSAQFPGYLADLFGHQAIVDLQADSNVRRWGTFAAWQSGTPDITGPAMPASGSTGVETYDGTNSGTYQGTYARWWTHDTHSTYRDGAHELTDPAGGDFAPTGAMTGVALANITYDVGPAWSAYEEASPTIGAVPYTASGVAASVPDGRCRVGASAVVTVTATSSDAGGVTSFSDISVTGPSGAVAFVRGSDSGIGTGSASTSVTFTPLAPGSYTVSATANDAGGSATDTGTVRARRATSAAVVVG